MHQQRVIVPLGDCHSLLRLQYSADQEMVAAREVLLQVLTAVAQLALSDGLMGPVETQGVVLGGGGAASVFICS